MPPKRPKPAKRPPKPSLMHALLRVVGDKPMSVKDAIAAVIASGFSPLGHHFPGRVGEALRRGPFERVGWGNKAPERDQQAGDSHEFLTGGRAPDKTRRLSGFLPHFSTRVE